MLPYNRLILFGTFWGVETHLTLDLAECVRYLCACVEEFCLCVSEFHVFVIYIGG